MDSECSLWLKECRIAFPKLKRYLVSCNYAKIPKGVLGRVAGTLSIARDVDPEAVLLLGKSGAVIRRKISGDFRVQINSQLRKIKNPLIRKQVVQHTLIHELLHIENRDMITLSKEYGRRKKKKIHKKEFEEKIHERFNVVRASAGLPPVKRMDDVDSAINKILSEISFE